MVFRFVQNSFFLDERNIRTTSLCSRFCVCVLFRRKKSPSLELALAEAVASKVDRHKKGGRKKAGERKMRPLPAKRGLARTHPSCGSLELFASCVRAFCGLRSAAAGNNQDLGCEIELECDFFSALTRYFILALLLLPCMGPPPRHSCSFM